MADKAKKQVLVRVPMPTHEKLVRRSISATRARGKTVSVPKMIVEILEKALNNPGEEKS